MTGNEDGKVDRGGTKNLRSATTFNNIPMENWTWKLKESSVLIITESKKSGKRGRYTLLDDDDRFYAELAVRRAY